MNNSNKTPLEIAVSTVGSKSELARRLGITPQAVNRFEKNGGKFPPKRAFQVANLTGLPVETFYPNTTE